MRTHLVYAGLHSKGLHIYTIKKQMKIDKLFKKKALKSGL